jgi:hypothetical protein
VRLLFRSILFLVGLLPLSLYAAVEDGNSNRNNNTASPLILQIRILEGEGTSYPAGTRAIKGITVEITDEAGLPVSGGAVSFRLPEDGPSGVFSNGTRTEIATTNANGRVTVWGMKWNRIPGSISVRVTAAKGETRAGAIVQQILLEPSQAAALAASRQEPYRGGVRGTNGKRWVWISAIAAAAAGGGLALGARSGGGSGNTSSSAGAVTGVSIGSPSIVVGAGGR